MSAEAETFGLYYSVAAAQSLLRFALSKRRAPPSSRTPAEHHRRSDRLDGRVEIGSVFAELDTAHYRFPWELIDEHRARPAIRDPERGQRHELQSLFHARTIRGANSVSSAHVGTSWSTGFIVIQIRTAIATIAAVINAFFQRSVIGTSLSTNDITRKHIAPMTILSSIAYAPFSTWLKDEYTSNRGIFSIRLRASLDCLQGNTA